MRPEVELGDYTEYPFEPTVEDVTEEQIDQVIEQLRDQQASLIPVEERGAENEDYAVISFAGTRDGQPVEGAQSDRFPLVLGKERMIPGFEANLLGMKEEDERTFTVTFPEDYAEPSLQGAEVEFTAVLLELRERKLPEADDDFAGLVGEYEDMAGLRADLQKRMEINALDRARHQFADRIIEYANGNATLTLPEVLVEREINTMIDELKVRVAEQGIAYDQYLKVTEKDEASLREEYKEGAEQRVKTLLVLGAIAEKEEVTVDEADVQAEIDRVLADPNAGDNIKEYLASDRGRNYIRSQLRRSQTVEMLADRWIEAHPEFENVQHQHGHSHDEEDVDEEETVDPVSEVVEEVTEEVAEAEGETKA